MDNLEARFNLHREELRLIIESASSVLSNSMANGMSLTYTEVFKSVLNEAQMNEYLSNSMTKTLCDDTLLAEDSTEVDHSLVAEHFVLSFSNIKSATESMRQLKKKHEAGKGGLWAVYVKAYKYDKGVKL